MNNQEIYKIDICSQEKSGGRVTPRFIDWMNRVNELFILKTCLDLLCIDSDYPEFDIPYSEWYYEAMSPYGAFLSILEMVESENKKGNL